VLKRTGIYWKGAEKLRGTAYRKAVCNWAQTNKPDIAAAFLIPRTLIRAIKGKQGYVDDVTLGQLLMHCFNKLDRQVFKSAHRKHGQRVLRFVTLEHTDEVGWHAHVLLTTPPNWHASDVSLLLQRLWLKQLRKFISPRFEDRLYWAEPVTGNYLWYATKQIGDGSTVDWPNAVIKSPEQASA
jgi:hypothetical protein